MDVPPSPPAGAVDEPEKSSASIVEWASCLVGRHAWVVDSPTRSCRHCEQFERQNKNIHGDTWWEPESTNPALRLWRLRILGIVAAIGWGASIVLTVALILTNAQPNYPTINNAPVVEFSNYLWTPRESLELAGPGPNFFAPGNVYLDDQGQLHLKVDRVDGEWRSAELISTRSLGYGTYTIRVKPLLGPLTDAVTLGFLTWDNDAAEEFHREMDVEIHRRLVDGEVSSGSFTVQPWDRDGHVHRFGPEPGSQWAIDWRPEEVIFEARDANNVVIESWAFEGSAVPTPGNEKIRINLWLAGGNPPGDRRPVEIIVEEFTFEPYQEVAAGR